MAFKKSPSFKASDSSSKSILYMWSSHGWVDMYKYTEHSDLHEGNLHFEHQKDYNFKRQRQMDLKRKTSALASASVC